MDVLFVYMTAADVAEARLIARTVVEERLAACANVLGSIESTYWWDGKVCEGQEVAVVLKTSAERNSALIDRIRQLHSYDCPAIACLPVVDGSQDYLEWIRKETG
jgi:periplasmic divalent cation tolerance protein